MKNKSFYLLFIALTMIVAASCTKQESKKPAFDVSNMDQTVKPGVDFFKYANGTWLKNTKMPDDKSRFGSFDILREDNDQILKNIFEQAAAKKDAPKGSSWQKVGDFFASGLDSANIEKQGFDPIKDDLARIAAIKDTKDVLTELPKLHTQYVTPLFLPYAGQDSKKSDTIIISLNQGGLGLPDRDYYLSDDDRSQEIRKDYIQHLTKSFTLIGYAQDQAEEAAQQVLKLETRLASVTQTRIDQRDPYLTYNKVTINEMNKLSSGIDWKAYFTSLGIVVPVDFIIDNPKFYAELSKLLKDEPIVVWKNYFTWNVINRYSSFLSDAFVENDFNFYSKKLSGNNTNQPRWQRVANSANFAIGELVGQIFVEENFPPQAKQKMLDLIGNLKLAFRERITNLSWMDQETKVKALDKLETMVVKVGYPDKWKDYTNLEISRDSYAGNIKNATTFSFRENMNKLGKAVDRTEWGMTPQTVNAYYNPSMNEIVFPAGILQPPFFNKDADDAVNYGGIGVVIGHEMTHGFDDQGRNFDKKGNLTDWWTKEDSEKFKALTQILVDQYDRFIAIDTIHLNGKLTLGENIADYGGLTMSHLAYRKSLEGKQEPTTIDGFTAEQRFFLSYGNIWRQIIRDKELMRRVKEDVHSPGNFRVNGALFNIPEFYDAFEINPTDPLFIPADKRAKIW
jgi:putative endopeptidase